MTLSGRRCRPSSTLGDPLGAIPHGFAGGVRFGIMSSRSRLGSIGGGEGELAAGTGGFWDTGPVDRRWPMGERPSGTVTFLFTDIEGSTRSVGGRPEAMRVALAAHDEVLRSAVEGSGRLVVQAHRGRGVRGVRLRPVTRWPPRSTPSGGWGCRCGWGWGRGTAERTRRRLFRSGAEPGRPGDGRRARRADPGGARRRRRWLTGFDLVDLGEHRLRDLSGVAPHLPGPRRGSAGASSRRCGPWTRCRGTCRSRPPVSWAAGEAVEELVEVVRAHRLVTLTGVGGVGKTRLALQVAGGAGPEFPDGVWLVELAPVGDPAALPDAVATALGVTPQAGSVGDRQRGRGAVGAADVDGVGQLRARAGRRRRAGGGGPGPTRRR